MGNVGRPMLIACTHCQRLVRRRDPSCPFCGAAVVLTPTHEIPRMTRAALVMAGAAAITACGVSSPSYGFPIPPFDSVDAEVEDADPVFPEATTRPEDATTDSSLDASTDAHPDADAADAPSSD